MPSPCSRSEASQRRASVEVDSYALHLDFASDPSCVGSRTAIRFRSRTGQGSTFAQLTADAIETIVLNGDALDPATVLADDRLVLDRLRVENELVVESSHPCGDDGRGFARHDQPEGSSYALAYAYPTSASRMFCCFDQPDLPARMLLSVAAPEGWECVTHARATTHPPKGRDGTWRFEIPALKPCELIVALGPYQTVVDPAGASGRLPRVLARPALANDIDPKRLVGLVRSALDFYADLFGVPAPHDWLEVAFVPGLPPLAVCVPGFVGLHEDLARRIADADDDFATMVIAHELAHLWFGCLVGCTWWDDLWLTEALATWASYVAGEQRLGMRAAWSEFAMAEKERAYSADQLPTTEPVASLVETAASATARPSALTYCKGAAVVRQLEALIGEDAVRAGLRRYFERFSGRTATLDDIVQCWSEASGEDLSAWSAEWLGTSGVNLLRPELDIAPDGTIRSLDIVQEPSDVPNASPVLRRHRVRVGLYGTDAALECRHRVDAVITGARTHIAEATGLPAPEALVVNDGDLAYARMRPDASTLAFLEDRSFELPDPLTEAVFWNALWDMTVSGELAPRQFVESVAARMERRGHPPAVDTLGIRGVQVADYYAAPSSRLELRARLAGACERRLGLEDPWSRPWRRFALVLARAAATSSQLDLIHRWLEDDTLRRPSGRDVARAALESLAAADRLSDDLLDDVANHDPAAGAETRAKCRALRPDPAAKEGAWRSALDPRAAPRIARASADGVWAPGQEAISAPFGPRYFDEALAALCSMGDDRARRVGSALFPLTLADGETVEATDVALQRTDLTAPLRSVLEENRVVVSRIITARSR